MPPPENVSAWLTQVRTQLGLTQRELANMLGFTESTLARWERGERLCEHPAALQSSLSFIRLVMSGDPWAVEDVVGYWQQSPTIMHLEMIERGVLAGSHAPLTELGVPIEDALASARRVGARIIEIPRKAPSRTGPHVRREYLPAMGFHPMAADTLVHIPAAFVPREL